MGTLPLAGSLIARAGRAAARTSKTIAGKVITGAANAAAGARTVVKELELTISALGEEFEHFKKLLQNMVEDIKRTGKTIMETPFSIRLEKVSLQFADGGYVGFGGYRVIINFADDVESTVGGGRTGKVLGGGLGGGRDTAEHMLGSNGTQVSSKTTWRNGRTERIDVENPAPGQRSGQIHYHDANNNKYYYDINSNTFYDPKTGELAPNSIQKILKNKKILEGIKKALRKHCKS